MTMKTTHNIINSISAHDWKDNLSDLWNEELSDGKKTVIENSSLTPKW